MFGIIDKNSFKGTKVNIIIIVILTLITTYNTTLYISSTQKLYDSFMGSDNYTKAIIYLSIISIVQILQIGLRQLQNYIEAKVQLLLDNNIERDFYKNFNPKTITKIETPGFQNLINSIKFGISGFTQLIIATISAAQSFILIIIYSVILVNQKWYLVLIVLIYNIPKFTNEIKLSQIRMQFFEQNSDISRQKAMYSELFTKSESQKEIMIFSMKKYLLEKWNEIAHKVLKLDLQRKKKDVLRSLITSIISPIGFMTIQFILLYNIFNKIISLGEYMAIITTIGLLEGALSSLAPYIGKIKQSFYIKDKLRKFKMEYYISEPANHKKNRLMELSKININSLSFKYPNSNRHVLHNISLDINKGDFIVIVGENGSGKSTLAKVLLGIHEVDDNQLFLNGTDINKIERTSIYEKMSVVTQDYTKYPFPLVENITMSTSIKTTTHKVFLNSFNYLLPEDLANNPDKLIGIDYEGSQQLSGGQWQRIAIARALYKESAVLVLDEATSAIDPETEMRIVKDITKARKNNITIFVTHRLQVAQYASQILVVKNGEITERGTHLDLVMQQGYYSKMINSQNIKGEDKNVVVS